MINCPAVFAVPGISICIKGVKENCNRDEVSWCPYDYLLSANCHLSSIPSLPREYFGKVETLRDCAMWSFRAKGFVWDYYVMSVVIVLNFILQSTDPCEKARSLAVPRSALYCRSLAQEGTFGRVYKGTLDLAGREQEVIIKTVTGEQTNIL